MSRTGTWICMITGGAIYQMAKPIFGFTPNFETLANAAYWSGSVLLFHWMGSTEPRP